MKAKRLTMALLVSLLISGLFTFWLSRRLAKPTHVAVRQKLMIVGAKETVQAEYDAAKKDVRNHT